MRTIASISRLVRPRSQLTLEVFLGKRVVLEPSLHFSPGLQSSVCILPSVCTLSTVCSLRFTQTTFLMPIHFWYGVMRLRVLFYSFLQNCDSTSTNSSLSQIKALLSLLKYIKQNETLSLRHEIKRKNLRSLSGETFCKCGRVTDVYQTQTLNAVDNLNIGIAFCLVS